MNDTATLELAEEVKAFGAYLEAFMSKFDQADGSARLALAFVATRYDQLADAAQLAVRS